MSKRKTPEVELQHCEVDKQQTDEAFNKVLDAIRAGAQSEMASFFELQSAMVRRLCQYWLHRFQVHYYIDADDIANEIFKECFDRLAKGALADVTSQGKFEKWVRLEAFGRVWKVARKRRSDPSHCAPHSHLAHNMVMSDGFAIDQFIDPGSEITDIDEAEHVRVALNYLPNHLRTIGSMHLLGISQTEIGQQLGLSRRTIARKLAEIFSLWKNWANQGT